MTDRVEFDAGPGMEAPGIVRRIACLPYEGLLLLALVLIATFPVAGMKGAAMQGVPHLLLQAYLFCVVAGYFVWFWTHGGQTLPMKTWHFKVVDRHGRPLNAARAFVRFVVALLFFGPACVGIVLIFFPNRVHPAIAAWAFLPMVATLLWARFDAERQFLHDRLARTRLVRTR